MACEELKKAYEEAIKARREKWAKIEKGEYRTDDVICSAKEFVRRLDVNYPCDKVCPIIWPKAKICTESSLIKNWSNAETREERRRLAIEIKKLPWLPLDEFIAKLVAHSIMGKERRTTF